MVTKQKLSSNRRKGQEGMKEDNKKKDCEKGTKRRWHKIVPSGQPGGGGDKLEGEAV